MTTSAPAICLNHPRFTIQRQLGAGAFGEVFQAFDQERQMTVALKALREANPDTIYRFKQEFRSLADMAHRNLVTLYELLSDGERWFFTMELIEGIDFLEFTRGGPTAQVVGSLGNSPNSAPPHDPAGAPTIAVKRVIAEAPDAGLTLARYQSSSSSLSLPSAPGALGASGAPVPLMLSIDRLLNSLAQLAEGLGVLHEADKLHRDIKPSNVLVTPDQRVVLLDFGLVKELSAPYELEQTLLVAGTPAYMSPEQAGGQAVRASDWYSVGVMLYQVLTGVLPFNGQLFTVLHDKQNFEPREPREFADIPEDLNALCCDLLRRDPLARPSGAEVLRRLGQARDRAHTYRLALPAATATLPLVGREEHLALLQQSYLTVKQQGRALTVLVKGSSGMGKTALVRRFLEDLPRREPEAVILPGRCYESESVPYKALDTLIDALSRYLKRLPAPAAEALMPRDVMALARLFPVLRQVGAVASARRHVLDIPDSQEIRRRAFAALRELLARLADRRPLVLFIDDLQWGDVDSGVLLAEILRPPDAPPLLLIASFRSEDAATSPFLRTLLPSLANSLETHELAVGELSAVDARRLALTLLRDADTGAAQLEAITRESRGSPFFVHELARYSSAAQLEAPASTEAAARAATLDEVIWARVTRLPERTRRLLEVVAVSGRPLELALARQAVSLEGEEQQALSALRVGRLLRSRGTAAHGELETYHDRVRETVVGHLEPAELRQHHLQLARVLEATGRADPQRLTVHFAAAGDAPRAASYAAAAAAQAVEALAFERAAHLYQRALDLRASEDGQTQVLRAKLADALANAGRGAEAAQAYLAARAGASSFERLELERRAAEQLLRAGHIDEGLQVIRTVLGAIGMKLPKTPRHALASLLWHRLLTLRGWKFRERSTEQVSATDLSRVDTCWSAALGLVMVDAMRAADFQSRNLLLSLKAGEPVRVARALSMEACYSSASGNSGRARTARLLTTAAGIAARVNRPEALGHAALAAGTAAWFYGEWRKAFALTEHAEAIFREQCQGVNWELNTAQHFWLRSLIFLGELPQMQRRLPRLLKEAQERGDLFAETNLRTRIAYLARLFTDEPELAREELRRVMSRWSQQAFHSQHYYELVARVEIALYEGEGIAAWEHLSARWPEMVSSLILRFQLTRIEALYLRARATVAAASAMVRQPQQYAARQIQRLLGQASSDARRIAREAMPWSDPLAQLIQAAVAAIRDDRQGALALLDAAEAGFARADMSLYQQLTRRRRGELIGGETGAVLVAEADRWIAEREVKQPARVAQLLAPGRW
jgi:serine/threonine protein kinase